jgi:hypothetical protein
VKAGSFSVEEHSASIGVNTTPSIELNRRKRAIRLGFM